MLEVKSSLSLTYGPSEFLTTTAVCLPQVGSKRTLVSAGSQIRSSLTSVTLTHPREASQEDPDAGLPPRSKFLKLISITRSAGASRYQIQLISFGKGLIRDLRTGLENHRSDRPLIPGLGYPGVETSPLVPFSRPPQRPSTMIQSATNPVASLAPSE